MQKTNCWFLLFQTGTEQPVWENLQRKYEWTERSKADELVSGAETKSHRLFVRKMKIESTKKRKSRETRFPCLGTGMKCPVRFKGGEPCPVSDVSSLSTGYYLPKPLLDRAGFSEAETPAGEFGG